MASQLPSILSGINNASNLLLAVPQISGLFGNQVSQTIGYQPQGQATTDAATILDSTSSVLNTLFAPPPALLFHYEGEQKVSLKSDITDHYVEDNSAIQDQATLGPVIIKTQGFIGELNDVPPNKAFQLAQIAANKLTVIGQYVPGLSATALNAYNDAFLLYQTALNAVNSAVSAVSSISGQVTGESVVTGGQVTQVAASQNKQQTMFQQLIGYYNSRTLFTIQTPWAVFQNCLIESIDATQDASTQVISEFSLVFKQVRFAQDLLTNVLQNNGAVLGRLAAQSSDVVNNGVSSLTNPSTTTLSSIIV